jgi:ABC-type transport system substrate-binding protein
MSRYVIAIVGFLTMVLGTLLAGLSPAAAVQDGPTPHVLRIYWGGSPPDTLDPHYSHEGQWDASGGVDFEGLTKLDDKLNPSPGPWRGRILGVQP